MSKLHSSKNGSSFQQEEEAQQSLAEDLIFQGKFSKALELYESLLQSPSFQNSRDTLKHAQVLDRISLIHFELCHFPEALEKCNESFRIKSLKHPDDDNIDLIESYRLFGLIYKAQDKSADSLTNFRKCEEILLKHYSKDHPKFFDISYELGLFYFAEAKDETALDYFNSSLNIVLSKDSLKPSDHVKIGKCNRGMGKIYHQKGLYLKSKYHYEKAKESYHKGLEPGHIELARVIDDFGHLFVDEGYYDIAKGLFEQSLALKLKHFEKHIEIAKSYFGLSCVAFKKDQLEEALAYDKKVIEMSKEFFEENHSAFGIMYKNAGEALWMQKKAEDALEYFSRAREIFSKNFGEDSYELSGTLEKMGEIYKFQKRFSQALECYLQSLAPLVKISGVENLGFGQRCIEIHNLLNGLEDYDEALKYYRIYLERRIAIIGEDNIVAIIYFNMARILNAQTNFEGSLKYYKTSLHIRLTKYQDDHLTIGNNYYNMAIVAKNLFDSPLAVRYYRASLQHYLIHWGPCHSDVIETVFRIGIVFKNMKKYDEAEAWFKIADVTQKKMQSGENFASYFTHQR